MAPRIHLNGSDGSLILRDLSNSIESLRKSAALLECASPHSRDYYVIGETAFNKAREEHVERAKKIRSVMAELVEIQESVLDQMGK